jgi:hypothetical protein
MLDRMDVALDQGWGMMNQNWTYTLPSVLHTLDPCLLDLEPEDKARECHYELPDLHMLEIMLHDLDFQIQMMNPKTINHSPRQLLILETMGLNKIIVQCQEWFSGMDNGLQHWMNVICYHYFQIV